MRLLQYGSSIARARIISSGNTHCLLLTSAIGDLIAVKSGFSSGYSGKGPKCFSATLQLLDSHGAEIDECLVEESTIDRLDNSALTIADVENLTKANAVRPVRWFQYVSYQHEDQALNGTLWREFPPVVPFAIIDSRIMDLARTFWANPDNNLLRGYRRLEDLVRERTGLRESSTKLFSRAFASDDAILTWAVTDESERKARANLFAAIYMAYRNPRAHQENPNAELLEELLLLNHLYRSERVAVKADSEVAASGSSEALAT